MARFLVAGGAGFLGAHMCAKLLELNHDVVCLDDFSTGRMENVAPFLEVPRPKASFELVRGRTEDVADLEIDGIYNFATPAGPQKFQAEPATTLSKLLRGALALMELAERRGIPVLIASTSEVYGDPLVHPQREDYFGNVEPVGIRSAYNEGKRAEEAIAAGFYRERGVSVKIARIFNTYGPGMDPNDGRMVSAFILKALHNEPIQILGDGSQTRTLAYVHDVIDGILSLMHLPKSKWEPVNLGATTSYGVLEIARTIIGLVDSRSTIEFLPAREGEPYRRTPDITKAQQLLGWQPSTDLEKGLEATILDLRRYL